MSHLPHLPWSTPSRRYLLAGLLLLVFAAISLSGTTGIALSRFEAHGETLVAFGSRIAASMPASKSNQPILWQPIGNPVGLTWDLTTPEESRTVEGSPVPKVIPYFKRATKSVEQETVTITTMATVDRLEYLHSLARRYQGPISVTIHVPNSDTAQQSATLAKVAAIYAQDEHVRNWVDAHIVLDDRKLQLNTWRNVARAYARSSYTLMHDIDFWPSANFRTAIEHPAILDRLRNGSEAFIVPCFFSYDQDLANCPEDFPQTKADLLRFVDDGKIGMPYPKSPMGQRFTSYKQWYRLPEGSEDYPVSGYDYRYEPYLLTNTHTTPYCDEIFAAHGDKAACVLEMYLAGIQFRVLTDPFTIHAGAKEPEPESASRPYNPAQRFYMALFDNFRQRKCGEYAEYFGKKGLLEDAKSAQFRKVCLAYPHIKETVKWLSFHGRKAIAAGLPLW